jgi:hypothetical protein
MNPTFHLFQLQKIDTQLDLLDNHLESIAFSLKNDSNVQSAKLLLGQRTHELSLLKDKLKSYEERIQTKRNKVEQSESSLYAGNIKNPKELQDLQKEIESIKSSINILEEEQLGLMLEIENSEKEVNIASQEYSIAVSEFENNNRLLIEEKTTLEQEKTRLSEERIVVSSQISSDIIGMYHSLRIRKSSIAIARIEDQTCSICGATLTLAEWQSAKSQANFFYCPSCGRILYAD